MRIIGMVVACVGLVTIVAARTYAQQFVQYAEQAQMVAHYPLNEGKGAVATDLTGIAGNGRIKGATWQEVAGHTRLVFDGFNDLVDCGNPDVLDITGPITLSAWMMPMSVPAEKNEVGVCGKYYTSYLLSYYSSTRSHWYIGAGSNHYGLFVPVGSWAHLAGVFDGTHLRFYLNGKLVGERKSAFSSVPHGGNFYIGSMFGDSSSDANYVSQGFFHGSVSDVRVFKGALSAEDIGRMYAADISRYQPGKVKVTRVTKAAGVRKGGLELIAGKNGGFEVRSDKGFAVIEGRFSYPGEKIGWNTLAAGDDAGDSSQKITITQTSDASLSATVSCPAYTLVRAVSLGDGYVEVEDRMRNRTDGAVGTLVHNQATISGAGEFLALTYISAPLMVITTPDMSVGVVAVDDVSRQYYQPTGCANRLEFDLTHVGVAGKAERVLKWRLYLLPSGSDMFTLADRVRKDFNANQTVLGPGRFMYMSPDDYKYSREDWSIEGLRESLGRRNLGVVILAPFLEYDPAPFPDTLSRAEYKELAQEMYRRIKTVDPSIRVLGSIETDWVGVWPDRMEDSDLLPVPDPKGAVRLTPEQTAVLKKANLPWMKDSARLDEQGRPLLELYQRMGKSQWALGVYPAKGNYQAWFLLDQARFLCQDVGLDGFYADEFSTEWAYSYDRWDGATVDINPETGKVIQKYASCNIAGVEARLDLCRYAVDHGKTMIGNSFATTFAEAAMPVMRFNELWMDFNAASLVAGKPGFQPPMLRGILGTPIGLGMPLLEGYQPTAELLMRGVKLYMRHGLVYYHYHFPDVPDTSDKTPYGFINAMFPITPVHTFAGGLVGPERIVTCVSDVYTRTGTTQPRVRLFGPDGSEKPLNDTTTVARQDDGSWSVRLKIDDWNEYAVIDQP